MRNTYTHMFFNLGCFHRGEQLVSHIISQTDPLVIYSACFPSDIQDFNTRLVSMLSLLQSCPDANRHTFLYLMHHLQRSEYDNTARISFSINTPKKENRVDPIYSYLFSPESLRNRTRIRCLHSTWPQCLVQASYALLRPRWAKTAPLSISPRRWWCR